MFIAEDFLRFKDMFVSKLKDMLSVDELGAFILVLANSQQDEDLSAAFQNDIKVIFDAMNEDLSSLREKSTRDDIDVFDRLRDINLDTIPIWQYKTIGHWEVVFNSMRQLRPARAATQTFTSIRQSFDETKFHFNKPFLKPEIFWEGEYLNHNLRVLYNKFPFSDYHLLIAVSPEQNCSQLLTQDIHQLIFELTQNGAETFSGFGVGFNSLAAGASVNHLHFQGFVRERLLPIEVGGWAHNGGEAEYQDIAFNCLYRENSCYVMPRKFQGTVVLPDWVEGAGWLDLAGVMTVSNSEIFDVISEQQVTDALSLLRV
jgi:diadenosine tetraphosphate (Ap4A) HIT family hydrolase